MWTRQGLDAWLEVGSERSPGLSVGASAASGSGLENLCWENSQAWIPPPGFSSLRHPPPIPDSLTQPVTMVIQKSPGL